MEKEEDTPDKDEEEGKTASKDKDAEDDSDEGEENAEGGDKKKKRISKKRIIIIATPTLLVVLLAIGLYFTGMLDALFGEHKQEEVTSTGAPPSGAAGAAGAADANKDVAGTIFYDLPEMIANIDTPEKRGNLVKFMISLELENKDYVDRIEEVMPSIKDAFLMHLRELRPEELEGSEGMYRLKEELLRRINRAIKPAKVYDIKFVKFEVL